MSTPGRAASSSRIASALIVSGVFAFLALQIAAAAAYPGGTFCDATAPRYQFWGNYVCDVMQPRSQAGVENALAVPLGTASFVAVAMAFVPFWWLVGGLVGRGLGWAVRVAGMISACATIVVALVPSGRWPLLHVAAVFAAAIPGLAAAVVGAIALWRAGRRGLGALGLLTLVAGAVDAAGYARAVLHGTRCNPALPGVQKIAALALVAWMVAVAAQGTRGRGARPGAG